MKIESEKIIAQRNYPDEYKILSKQNYPDEYILFACKWIHEGHSSCLLKWCLTNWKLYVGSKYDIHSIIDLNDLVHTIDEFKRYGKRDISKRTFTLKLNLQI